MTQINHPQRKSTKRIPVRTKGRKPLSKEKKIVIHPDKLSPAEQAKRAMFLKRLDEWMADESGEQERSWAVAEKLLKENAMSYRNRSNG